MAHNHKHDNAGNPLQLIGIGALAALIGAISALFFSTRSKDTTRQAVRRRLQHRKGLRAAVDTADTPAYDAAADLTDDIARPDLTKQAARTVSRSAKRVAHAVQDEVDHIRKHGER